jgi:hypothetical protein
MSQMALESSSTSHIAPGGHLLLARQRRAGPFGRDAPPITRDFPVNSDRSFTGNCGLFAEYRVSTCGIALKIAPSTITTTCETHMNTLTTKLTAFTAALVMNSLIMGALGFLFEIQSHPNMSVVSFAKAVAAHQWFI